MNVLVYSGNGTSAASVRQAVRCMHYLLVPNYSVRKVDAEMLLNEPWIQETSVLVVPGGRDTPYCADMNGAVNRKIKRFVKGGGIYIGFCAGGYYGSKRCEFELDNKFYRIAADRELAFFPGTCRGCAFDGFVYNSESGARPAHAVTNKEQPVRMYWNGGGVFLHDDFGSIQDNVRVLARYTDMSDMKKDVLSQDGTLPAAVVLCHYGQGKALLTGVHCEYFGFNMDPQEFVDDQHYRKLVFDLRQDDSARVAFMRETFELLGLRVNDSPVPMPSLSHIHLCAENYTRQCDLFQTLTGLSDREDGQSKLICSNDTFILRGQQQTISLQDLQESLDRAVGDIDLDRQVKYIINMEPDTPIEGFDKQKYFAALAQGGEGRRLGKVLFHAKVITSTQTMLDKNLKLSRALPHGTICVGGQQLTGRGRSNNMWISPVGLLAFSLLIEHATQRPERLVFMQYLASIAIVEAIRSYAPGYEDLDVRIKWPNDIYARVVHDDRRQGTSFLHQGHEYFKMAGILVTSHVVDGQFKMVIGCGINVFNASPAASIRDVVNSANGEREKRGQSVLEPVTLEGLLGKIMLKFEDLYEIFVQQDRGFAPFLDKYYRYWLHTDQVVTLEMMGHVKAKITGISQDHGLLVVREISDDIRRDGRTYTLQSDGNSFDMMKGLVKRKT